MQVAKLRPANDPVKDPANDNGLAPAGRYFARLAEHVRAAKARAAAIVDIYENQARPVEARIDKNGIASADTKARCTDGLGWL